MQYQAFQDHLLHGWSDYYQIIHGAIVDTNDIHGRWFVVEEEEEDLNNSC